MMVSLGTHGIPQTHAYDSGSSFPPTKPDHYNYGAKTHETRCIAEHVLSGICNFRYAIDVP